MNPLWSEIASHPLVFPLAGALLHSVWQIALIGGLAWVALRTISVLTASDRYHVLLMALAAIPVSFLVTLRTLLQRVPVDPAKEFLAIAHSSSQRFTASTFESSSLLLLIILIWTTGMTVISLKTICGFIQIHRLKQRLSHPVSWEHTASLKRLCQQAGLNRIPDVRHTARLISPVVMGFIRPVILVPTGFFTNIAPEFVEAILLHELVHLKRKDYLINLLQHGVEIGFFYHPCTWWISSAIRDEREMCCDELVINSTGDALSYAKALLCLGSQKGAPALAMPVTGSKHKLYHRIKHLLEDNSMNTQSTGRLFAVLAIFTGLILIAGMSGTHINAKSPDADQQTRIVKVVRVDGNTEELDETEITKEITVEVLADATAPDIDLSIAGADIKILESTTDTLDEILTTLNVDLSDVDLEIDSSNVNIVYLKDGESMDLDGLIDDLEIDIDDIGNIDLSSSDFSDNLYITMENGEITSVTDNGREVPASEFENYEDQIPELEMLQGDNSGVKTLRILRGSSETETD